MHGSGGAARPYSCNCFIRLQCVNGHTWVLITAVVHAAWCRLLLWLGSCWAGMVCRLTSMWPSSSATWKPFTHMRSVAFFSSPGSCCFAVTEAHCTFTVAYKLAVVSCSKHVGAAQLIHEQQVTDHSVLRVSPEANGRLTNSSKVLEHA